MYRVRNDLKGFLIRRWFLILLALLLAAGMVWSEPLRPLAASSRLRQTLMLTVMFLMAFPLQARTMWNAVQRPRAPLLGVLVNGVVVPLLAWGLYLTLRAGWSGFSQDMGWGILVAASVPTTLASAAVWTRRAGGNDSVAILVTLITNLACFLVTPAWLALTIGRVPHFDPWSMAVQLTLLVVLPLVAAQLLRLAPPIAVWATDRKTPIGVLAQCGVLLMIFLGAVQTGNRLAGDSDAGLGANVAVMIVAVLAIHLVSLGVGLRCSRHLGIGRDDAIAVGFAGSQKTTMVGLEVAAQLGVTMLPMVAYHVGQLLADTVIADRLRERTPEHH